MRRITLPGILTTSRFFLAPVFAGLYGIIQAGLAEARPLVAALWVVFLVTELTDVLDGFAARQLGVVSEVGKVLDPFADVFARLTYFVCLNHARVLPLWFLLIVLYRELLIILIRMLMYRGGVALGARTLGKLKSWFYSLATAGALVVFSLRSLPGVDLDSRITRIADPTLLGILVVTAVLSVSSFAQYLTVFLRPSRRSDS